MQINKKIIFGITIVFVLALSRVLPHPPNFTPILGMAFFAGAVFDKKVLAYCISILAMLVSDLYLGFHAGMPIIYFAICVCILIGTFFHSKLNLTTSFLGISAGVISFYLISNFAVWYGSGMYASDLNGLITCYIMALPFLQNTFLSSIFYGMAACVLYLMADKHLKFSAKQA